MEKHETSKKGNASFIDKHDDLKKILGANTVPHNLEMTEKVLHMIAEDVKQTAGPYGHNVIDAIGIQPHVTKDGANTLLQLNYRNPYAECIKGFLSGVVEDALDTVGDGTTTATAITASLFSELKKVWDKHMVGVDRKPKRFFEENLIQAVADIKLELDTNFTKDVDHYSVLEDLAYTSLNGDTVMTDVFKEIFETFKVNDIAPDNVAIQCVRVPEALGITVIHNDGFTMKESSPMLTHGKVEIDMKSANLIMLSHGIESPAEVQNVKKLEQLILDNAMEKARITNSTTVSLPPIVLVARHIADGMQLAIKRLMSNWHNSHDGAAYPFVIINGETEMDDQLNVGHTQHADLCAYLGTPALTFEEWLSFLSGDTVSAEEDENEKCKDLFINLEKYCSLVDIKSSRAATVYSIVNRVGEDFYLNTLKELEYTIEHSNIAFDIKIAKNRMKRFNSAFATIVAGSAKNAIDSGRVRDQLDDAARAVTSASEHGVVAGLNVTIPRIITKIQSLIEDTVVLTMYADILEAIKNAYINFTKFLLSTTISDDVQIDSLCDKLINTMYSNGDQFKTLSLVDLEITSDVINPKLLEFTVLSTATKSCLNLFASSVIIMNDSFDVSSFRAVEKQIESLFSTPKEEEVIEEVIEEV